MTENEREIGVFRSAYFRTSSGPAGPFLNISHAAKEQGEERKKGQRRRLLVKLSSTLSAHLI